MVKLSKNLQRTCFEKVFIFYNNLQLDSTVSVIYYEKQEFQSTDLYLCFSWNTLYDLA